MNLKNLQLIFIFLLLGMLLACEEETFIPKPRGYFSIPFPEKKYQPFSVPGYPYTFEYPTYANIEKDTMFFEKKAENPWWININFPELGGKIFISYKIISPSQPLSKLLEDTYQMSYYHTKKADFINDSVFHFKNNVHGLCYDVGGNAASAFQFYATDSFHHFLRGALYFDTTPNADSLKPVNQFLRNDIQHLIQTLNWTR